VAYNPEPKYTIQLEEEFSMTTKRWLLGILVILAVSGGVSAQRVAGVWKLDEIMSTGTGASSKKITQPSMYLFTKTHYSIIYVGSDSARSTDEAATMTADQLRDVYVKSFTANAGTYDVTAGKITLRPVVAKNPSYMTPGKWLAMKITVKGNSMTLVTDSTNEGPATNPATFKLTRVE
jgi:hypothetical protein